MGSPMDNVKEAGKAFEKFKAMSHVLIFQKSRHEFYLIKDDGHSKEQLMDSLGAIKKQVASIENRVEIIDLMDMCSLRKRPILSNPIKYKTDDGKEEALCQICE
jgi:hypothetical protein